MDTRNFVLFLKYRWKKSPKNDINLMNASVLIRFTFFGVFMFVDVQTYTVLYRDFKFQR